MKTFLIPAKYQMAIPKGIAGVGGALILPSGISRPTLFKRKLSKKDHLTNRFLDPQYYLAQIQATNCRKTCARLATYPWFDASSIPDFISDEQSQADYNKQITNTIHRSWKREYANTPDAIARVIAHVASAQRNLRCSAFLLPSPLVVDQGDNLTSWIEWLDIGCEQMSLLQTDIPIYATIAVSDSALRLFEPEANQMLAVMIDQITARDYDGVYICLEQTLEAGYYCSHTNTLGSILHLVWGLKQGGIKNVMIAPMGLAGYLCLGAGADIWSCGWYLSERRLKLSDMEDRDGRAVPTYYSHKLASEIHTEQDLDILNRAGLIDAIEDVTENSQGLLEALRLGVSAGSIPEWESRPTNVTAAKDHFIRSVTRETQALASLPDKEVADYIHAWVANSEELAFRAAEAGVRHARTEVKHQSAWLAAFKRFRTYSGI